MQGIFSIFLHHCPHKKLASKQIRRHESAILGHSNFIWTEFHPVCKVRDRIIQSEISGWRKMMEKWTKQRNFSDMGSQITIRNIKSRSVRSQQGKNPHFSYHNKLWWKEWVWKPEVWKKGLQMREHTVTSGFHPLLQHGSLSHWVSTPSCFSFTAIPSKHGEQWQRWHKTNYWISQGLWNILAKAFGFYPNLKFHGKASIKRQGWQAADKLINSNIAKDLLKSPFFWTESSRIIWNKMFKCIFWS